MSEPIKGREATEEEMDEIMDVIGGFPKRAAKQTEPTEESKLLDELFKEMGI